MKQVNTSQSKMSTTKEVTTESWRRTITKIVSFNFQKVEISHGVKGKEDPENHTSYVISKYLAKPPKEFLEK